MITREMVVGEARDTLQVFLIHFSEQSGDLQQIGGVPDVIDDIGEAWRVVGEGELAYGRVG